MTDDLRYRYVTALVDQPAYKLNPFGSVPIVAGQLGLLVKNFFGDFEVSYVGKFGRDYTWFSTTTFRQATNTEIMAISADEDRELHGLLLPMWTPRHRRYPNGFPP